MGRIVIVGYRPKAGCREALRALVTRHVTRLRELGLASERPAIVMEAKDGTLVEVFEWRSSAAIDEAHGHPAVQALWAEFERVCEYVPVGTLTESMQLFSEFTPLA
jgi:quinol monooxygenase YgiN